MRRIISSLMCLVMFLTLFINNITVLASEKYIGTLNGNDVAIRTKPIVSGSDVIDRLSTGHVVELTSLDLYPGNEYCDSGWYEVNYKGSTGYICSVYLDIEKVIEPDIVEPQNEYEDKLEALGFPSSYWSPLYELHKQYPNWNFEPIMTGLTFDSSVAAQSILGKSLIQTSKEGYRSTQAGSFDYLTDTFKVFEGSNWYAASDEIVAFYMDPRNSMTDTSVFQFLKLNHFDGTYQTEEAVKAVFTSDSYLNDFAKYFVQAGKTYNINSIFLASRVRKEVGVNVGFATSGLPFVFYLNGRTYSSLYNLYNIGATSGINPAQRGLIWANGGEDGTLTSYNRPWTSIDKSIIGGAEFLASAYIDSGQYTTYLQRFNVDPGEGREPHTNQYMTNISAPGDESYTSYISYRDMGLLESNLTFAIPVYENLGEISNRPNPGNPNNHLSSLSVNGSVVTNFSHDKYDYELSVSSMATAVKIDAKAINSKASITGGGEVLLTGDTTTADILVTAENGDIQKYSVLIKKTDSESMTIEDILNQTGLKSDASYFTNIPRGIEVNGVIEMFTKVSNTVTILISDATGVAKTSGVVSTGDKVTIKNGEDELSYTVVIRGDNDGDGEISIIDLLRIQKHLLNYSKLETYNSKASDVDDDGEISIIDLLKVQKHLLGISTIE